MDSLINSYFYHEIHYINKCSKALRMKVKLSPETISAIEEASETKLTRNADKVIRELAETVKSVSPNETEKGIEVCDFTAKMAGEDES